MGNCCSNCFDDHYLKAQVDEKSTHKGNCDYCGSRDIRICDSATIGEIVQAGLLRIYEPVGIWHERNVEDRLMAWLNNDDSESLYSAIKQERFLWAGLDDKAHRCLTQDLIKDGFSKHELSLDTAVVKRPAPGYALNGESWARFRFTVQHYARFFRNDGHRGDNSFLDMMGSVLSWFSLKLPMHTGIYRARRFAEHISKTAVGDLGPPPAATTKRSRMSPIGIPYMYAGDSEELCIAELRPPVGCWVCVGHLETKREIRLLDLCRQPSLFDSSVPDNVLFSRDALRSFQEEVGWPVSSSDDALEYLPTQVFSEFARSQYYDGIRYPGVQGLGINYAFFCGCEETDYPEYRPAGPILPSFTEWFKCIGAVEYRILSVKYCLSGGHRVDLKDTRPKSESS